MLVGTKALEAIREDFASVDLSPPSIPEHFVDSLRYDPSCADQVCPIQAGDPPVFNSLAPYGLEFNELPENYFPRSDDGNFLSLAGYVEMYPSTDGFLVYGSRANEGGTGHGWMIRSGRLFVVQQAWQSSEEKEPYFTPFNIYSKALDWYLGPHLQQETAPTTVLIVFSDYRNIGIIASPDQKSWDPELRGRPVAYGPLPEGWGPVFDLSKYGYGAIEAPRRAIESLMHGNHSNEINSAANYLNECLRHRVLKHW